MKLQIPFSGLWDLCRLSFVLWSKTERLHRLTSSHHIKKLLWVWRYSQGMNGNKRKQRLREQSYWRVTTIFHMVLTRNSVTHLCFLPAVSLWYFLDGQSYLVAEVASRVHHSERALSQNDPLSVLIVLVVILWGKRTTTTLNAGTSHCSWHYCCRSIRWQSLMEKHLEAII